MGMIQDWTAIVVAFITSAALIVAELIRSKKLDGIQISWNGAVMAALSGAVVWLVWNKGSEARNPVPQVKAFEENPAVFRRFHNQCEDVDSEKTPSIYCLYAIDNYCKTKGYATGIPNAGIEPGVYRVNCIGKKT
jgi:hypothetical protein